MLKQLRLNKELKILRSSLLEIRERENSLTERSARAAEAIEEIETEEDKAAVDEEIDAIEKEREEIDAEKSKLEGEIEAIENELDELNSSLPTETKREERGETVVRDLKFFEKRDRVEVEAMFQREEVKSFMQDLRGRMEEKRAISGAELTIPDVFIGILRENLGGYSKLLKHVALKKLNGKGRTTIAGTIPEGIWTEACAKLNELSLAFNQVEVDGYKVGGFVPVCNATLEDSDLSLANEVMTAISKAIGIALDKAILYGTGTKMPVGIVTRLAETSEPSYWGNKEADWTNLSATNLLLSDPAATDDIEFYKDLITKLSIAKSEYATNGKFWAMSEKTFTKLQTKMLSINAAGAIVTGQSSTMPIVGGAVETLEFIPDDHIIGGYGEIYTLSERKGVQLASSEHAQFIEDNTVFKGTARYDGRPVFGEAFVAINIAQSGSPVAPKPTDVTFAPDDAN